MEYIGLNNAGGDPLVIATKHVAAIIPRNNDQSLIYLSSGQEFVVKGTVPDLARRIWPQAPIE